MDKAAFWKIIDSSRKQANNNVDKHLKILHKEVSKLSEEEIIQYDAIFVEYWVRAYTWELWAAAYIIGGGCSDDGFMDFRGWLISKGEKIYENALSNPETLSSVVKEDEECQIEGFQYIASKAWADITGYDASDFPETEVSIPDEPTGESWEEDELEDRFPKLWKKFS